MGGVQSNTHAGKYRPNNWNAAGRSFGGKFDGECWGERTDRQGRALNGPGIRCIGTMG
jgi:hypothetical protein